MSGRIALAIDPGRRKCGVAIVRSEAGTMTTLHREICPTESLTERVAALAREFRPDCLFLGDGTMGAELAAELATIPGLLPPRIVAEAYSSQRARRRYLEETPARGLARLVPLGLRVPDRPVDDFVAVLLAEEGLRADLT